MRCNSVKLEILFDVLYSIIELPCRGDSNKYPQDTCLHRLDKAVLTGITKIK